jgi:hypothetical protein
LHLWERNDFPGRKYPKEQALTAKERKEIATRASKAAAKARSKKAAERKKKAQP